LDLNLGDQGDAGKRRQPGRGSRSSSPPGFKARLLDPDTAGDHLDAWALRRRYYRALKKARLPRIRFHDLRHCFGSAAITKLDAYAV
jgi:integrase